METLIPEMSGVIDWVVQLGVTSVLLLLFTRHFFRKDKERDKQYCELHERLEKREELLRSDAVRREDQYRERERILTAESARREEILKRESEKREKIIREEAAKRENALLSTIDSFSGTMQQISETLTQIKNTITKMQYKVDNVEQRLSKGAQEHGQKT